MIKIQKTTDCCGCSACAEICPKQCISLDVDYEGFWYPQINSSICIDCHLCESVCPVLNPGVEHKPLHVYAAINKNDEIRARSASGGVFTIIAEKVIDEGGVVFGVKFDRDWNVIFGYTETKEGLEEFRRSKYVQAWVGESYREVKRFLKEGKKVLFTGLPCQIAGLNLFLKKEYTNLITVDLICEGVPSPKLWRKYLDEEFVVYKKKYRTRTHITSSSSRQNIFIKDISFRNKSLGWSNFSFSLTIAGNSSENSQNIVFPSYINRNSAYMQLMFRYGNLRPICYVCPFKCCKSGSDLTIADYWGISQLHPEMDDDKGTSMVFVNTMRGKKYFDLSKTHYLETSYEESWPFNNVVTSSKKHPKRDYFYSQIDKRQSVIKLMNDISFPFSYKVKKICKEFVKKSDKNYSRRYRCLFYKNAYMGQIKKRIKLITFAPHPNFGTCLQSYALNNVLQRMGHDVEFIYNGREIPPLTFSMYVKKSISKIARKILSESMLILLKERLGKRTRGKKSSSNDPVVLQLPDYRMLYWLSKLPGYEKCFKMYKCKNLQWRKVYQFTYEDNNFKMRRIYTHKQYNEVVADTDIFITGSDQIWNPYCGGFNPMMFVEFGKDKKRIAYSSSIAQPEIPQQIKERMKQDLLKFKYIGVREQRSVELLNVLLGRTDIRLVVDPTYLLSMEEWMEFGEKAVLEFPLPKKYIFCYFVGDKRKEIYEQMVQDVKKFAGIDDVVTLECYNRKLNYGGGKLYKDGGPYEWVYLLRHASYICMDSFHATVFALKFKKEFVHALKNSDDETESQNTRMYDIFNRYGLSHKIYFPSSSESWQLPIDYSKVTPIMELEIENSIKFLEYSINN